MKKTTFYSFIFLFIAAITSCTHKPEENPKEIDNPGLREKTGGTPDESSTLITSNFHSPEMSCKKGFGLCQPQFLDPKALYPDSTKTNPNERVYKALVYLGTDKNVLQLEFNEEIPHMETYFTVKGGDTLTNVLGHEYIIPVEGKYKTEKDVKAKYGRITINIKKGKEKTTFPEKQN